MLLKMNEWFKKNVKKFVEKAKIWGKNNNTVKIDVNAEKNDGIIELIHWRSSHKQFFK